MAERKVVVTEACKLRSRYILHIDAEHYRTPGNWEDAYTDILKEAESIGLKSITLPAIGTGKPPASLFGVCQRLILCYQHFIMHCYLLVYHLVIIVLLKRIFLVRYSRNMVSFLTFLTFPKVTVSCLLLQGDWGCLSLSQRELWGEH